jgi:hypothetical protein
MRALPCLLVLLPGLAAQTTPAQTAPARDPLDALVADSPFLPPAGGIRKNAAGPAGPLELRGVVFENGAYSFSLYDDASHESAWVRLGEGGHSFVARSFNRERDTLTVDYQGRSVVLTLPPAKMASTTPAGEPPPPALPGKGEAPKPTGAAPKTSAGKPAPAAAGSNTAEAQRLEDLANEIRRRRGNGPQPAPPPPKG